MLDGMDSSQFIIVRYNLRIEAYFKNDGDASFECENFRRAPIKAYLHLSGVLLKFPSYLTDI
jgi:hypothetical protein